MRAFRRRVTQASRSSWWTKLASSTRSEPGLAPSVAELIVRGKNHQDVHREFLSVLGFTASTRPIEWVRALTQTRRRSIGSCRPLWPSFISMMFTACDGCVGDDEFGHSNTTSGRLRRIVKRFIGRLCEAGHSSTAPAADALTRLRILEYCVLSAPEVPVEMQTRSYLAIFHLDPPAPYQITHDAGAPEVRRSLRLCHSGCSTPLFSRHHEMPQA